MFEFNRPFGSTITPECTKCGGSNTTKQLSTPSITFKGSGFYKTDSITEKAPQKPSENSI